MHAHSLLYGAPASGSDVTITLAELVEVGGLVPEEVVLVCDLNQFLIALSSLEAHLHQRLNHGVDRVPARGTDALAAHRLANAASGLDLDRGRVVQALGP